MISPNRKNTDNEQGVFQATWSKHSTPANSINREYSGLRIAHGHDGANRGVAFRLVLGSPAGSDARVSGLPRLGCLG
jgi:hypothetical protein